jgi:hypothetical protein
MLDCRSSNKIKEIERINMMEYFIVSKSHLHLASEISRIFKNTKDVEVICDRRRADQPFSENERRELNKVEKIN